jgi:signal transduction histidine kinase
VTVELTAILTEAVRNAVDHAAATTIRIDGYSDRDHGKLVVSDDGAGFDPSVQPKGHFGLIGMRERAAEVGATLAIDAAPGKGCRITIEWEGDE